MRNLFVLSGLLLLSPVACSSDGTTNGGTGGSGTPVVLLADGGCPDPTNKPVYDGVSQCLDTTTAISTCKANSAKQAPGKNTTDSTCGAGCACENCASEMFLCSTDPDCVKILLCAQEHNCSSTACYAPDKCQAIIDAAGGGQGITSNAVALVQLVDACVNKKPIPPYDFTNRAGPVCAAGCQ